MTADLSLQQKARAGQPASLDFLIALPSAEFRVIRYQVKSNMVVIIITSLIMIFAIFFYGKHILFKMNWKFISSATSPNGEFTIKYFQSRTEAGHAPYGDNLVIESYGSFPAPKTGETFFAGYCGEGFSFKWEGNDKIIIRCPNVTEQDPIKTQAILVQGIKVEVNEQ